MDKILTDLSNFQMGELVLHRLNTRSDHVGYVVGIDPGKKGGVTVMSMDGQQVWTARLGEAYELADFIDDTKRKIVRAYVEKCQAMPGQGVKSMFTYGMGFGKILGVLETLQISYDLIPPQKWQKKMIPGTKKGETKHAALIKARQLFPKHDFVPEGCRVAHDGIVDSVLIAEYGRGLHAPS